MGRGRRPQLKAAGASPCSGNKGRIIWVQKECVCQEKGMASAWGSQVSGSGSGGLLSARVKEWLLIPRTVRNHWRDALGEDII